MSGNHSRRKGGNFELECKHTISEAGFNCDKVPLSGAVGGVFSGDLHWVVAGRKLVVECKRRKRAFAWIYSILGDNDMLIHRDDRQESVVTMRLDDLLKLLRCTQNQTAEPMRHPITGSIVGIPPGVE